MTASFFALNASRTAPGILEEDAFPIGARARDADDRIIYDDITGALFYDANGTVPDERSHFATLDPGLNLTAADFLVV